MMCGVMRSTGLTGSDDVANSSARLKRSPRLFTCAILLAAVSPPFPLKVLRSMTLAVALRCRHARYLSLAEAALLRRAPSNQTDIEGVNRHGHLIRREVLRSR